MLSHTRTLLRLLGRLVLVMYFIVALGTLGVRYWLLPNIDQFRPYVAQQLSVVLGMPINFSHVKAKWSAWNPTLTLTDVSLRDTQGDKVFAVPMVRARFSWRSLLTWQPHFVDLEASGIDLTVRQDANQQLQLLGQSLDLDAVDTGGTLSAEVIAWLSSQPRIVLSDAVIRWVDETRDARPLVLRNVTLNLQNEGVHHKFSLRAKPPTELGELLDIRGDFQRLTPDPDGLKALEQGQGQLYFHVDGMQPLGWEPWIDIPPRLRSGVMTAKLWLQLAQGEVNHVTADFTVNDGHWVVQDATHIKAGYSRIYLVGPALAFRHYLGQPDQHSSMVDTTLTSSLSYRLDTARLSLEDATQFEMPLVIDTLAVQGQLGYDSAGLQVGVDILRLSNADIDTSLQGEWHQDGTAAGTIRLQGQVRRAAIASIVNYVPKDVDAATRAWLAHGLAAGEIYDATVVLEGPLAAFPFDQDESLGDFNISGHFRDAVIDYLPTEGKVLGWPTVRDMQGTVAMRRAGLYIKAESAKLLPDGKQPVHLKNISAKIPDMAGIAILHIDGPTQGDAAAYLGLMKHSALGPLLDNMFDQTTATGVWQVPLSLTIPLSTDDDPTVQGHIQFNGGEVRLMPQLPPLQQIQGKLSFTDQKVSASKLATQFLGSAAIITGELGGKSKGLVMQGRSAASAWADYIKVKGMERIKGEMAYSFQVQEAPVGQLSFRLKSDLRGVALMFPEPLTKPANKAMPLQALWQSSKDGKTLTLDIQLGSDINAKFLHKPASKQGPYFYAGAVGVKHQPNVLPIGTNLDIQSSYFDADAWQSIVQEFAAPADKAAAGKAHASNARVMFPDVRQLRLQAKQGRMIGLDMNELTYTANNPEGGQWRVDISSSETAGTIRWLEEKGKVVGAVQADFHRLSLGSAASETTPDAEDADTELDLKVEDELTLPAINLNVKNLSLYGRDAGELSLVGVNQDQGHRWILKKISLSSPHATLTGTGVWRLQGQERGLSLDATAQIKDLGAYFDQLGFPGIMEAGHGTAKGAIEWRNMPWGFSRADINGTIALELDEGRFASIGSKSARLLELLSFQSFSRMARLDLNPKSLTKDGFPYDSLRGTVVLDKGIAHTQNYRVIGPVGTIMLDGQTNLIDETLDALAVVIPNLDVSGAAIAAGFAINPIVGVGTFLTQWLLKEPLAKAMTAQYHIGGSWTEPKVSERGAKYKVSEPGTKP